eukprot:NODE_244_length_11882_cov_0.560214.p10 type:complete len:144 gc:universal NODE_244_length_11882_cov_0.560214:9851-9420(-)
MFQLNQNLTSHPSHVKGFQTALKKLLVINMVFYTLSNLLQAEIVPTSQDLILLLLGFLSVEINSINSLRAYIKLSIISIAIDFASLLSVFFLVSSLKLPGWIDFLFLILFVVENYFKYEAIKFARKIKIDWKSVQLPIAGEQV